MESVVALPERPEPPSFLTEDEAREWRAIVATKPADWFMRDTQPVLVALCQAICMHRTLMAGWHEGERKVNEITKAANLVASLSTKLRLTPQSRYTPQAARTANKRPDGRPLWQKQ